MIWWTDQLKVINYRGLNKLNSLHQSILKTCKMRNIHKFTSKEISHQMFKLGTKLNMKLIMVDLEILIAVLCIIINSNYRLIPNIQMMPSLRPLKWWMKRKKQLQNFTNIIKLINELILLVPSNNKYKFNIIISNKIWEQDYNNSLNLNNNIIIIIYFQMRLRQKGSTESVWIKVTCLSVLRKHHYHWQRSLFQVKLLK